MIVIIKMGLTVVISCSWVVLVRHEYFVPFIFYLFRRKEEFEDTKEAIRIRISKRNIQHNGHKKKYKRTNNNLQNSY
jgi:hypothetical protein